MHDDAPEAVPIDDPHESSRRRPPSNGFSDQVAAMGDVGSSVWPVAQRSLAVQRRGRFVAGSGAHPGRMAPDLAAHVIRTYSRPGDLVLDPMCGIGTTLIEAVHAGRDAYGVEYEARWAALARDNLVCAAEQGAAGTGTVVTGDARDLTGLLPADLAGRVGLVLTSPPYGPSTHGRASVPRGPGPVLSHLHEDYGDRRDRSNLAHTDLPGMADGLHRILTGCAQLLRPGGVVVVIARPWRRDGLLIDLPGMVMDAAQSAGLELFDRCVALLAAEHAERLTPRHSFHQLLQLRWARSKGNAHLLLQHEDALLFRSLPSSLSSREPESSQGEESAPGSSGAAPLEPAGPVEAGESVESASGAPVEGLLNVDDVCAWLKVARHWVYDEVEARRLPHVRLGRRTLRFRRQDIEAYLDERAHEPGPLPQENAPDRGIFFGDLESLD